MQEHENENLALIIGDNIKKAHRITFYKTAT